MSELQRIQDQIARSLDEEAWHGPALMQVLSGVDARAATARPIPSAHTIWEILLQVPSSAELVVARLMGEARTLSPEEDWPAPPTVTDHDTWEADVRRPARSPL